MNQADDVAVGWLLILFSMFFYFFGRAHGRLAEKKDQPEREAK